MSQISWIWSPRCQKSRGQNSCNNLVWKSSLMPTRSACNLRSEPSQSLLSARAPGTREPLCPPDAFSAVAPFSTWVGKPLFKSKCRDGIDAGKELGGARSPIREVSEFAGRTDFADRGTLGRVSLLIADEEAWVGETGFSSSLSERRHSLAEVRWRLTEPTTGGEFSSIGLISDREALPLSFGGRNKFVDASLSDAARARGSVSWGLEFVVISRGLLLMIAGSWGLLSLFELFAGIPYSSSDDSDNLWSKWKSHWNQNKKKWRENESSDKMVVKLVEANTKESKWMKKHESGWNEMQPKKYSG